MAHPLVVRRNQPHDVYIGRPSKWGNPFKIGRDAIREAAGVPWLHFHDLRHVNATLLLRAGVSPKVTQQRLGHTNAKMTDLYTHVMAEQQDEAASKLRELLK